MKRMSAGLLILVLVCCAIPARGQSVAVSVGGIFPGSFQQTGSATPAQASFSDATLVAVDGDMGFLPLLGGEIHYSHSTPGLSLRTSNGSTAGIDLSTQTVTLDAVLHSPAIAGFRVYGFLGGGFSRFGVDVTGETGSPFPGGAPGSLLQPVFTYGGGVQKKFLPLLSAKLEFRDDLSSIPGDLFAPGGGWQRFQTEVGIVIGR